MFGGAEYVLARHRDHLTHVEMKILAALGDDRVAPPGHSVAGEHDDRGALPPPRIDQRFDKRFKPREQAGPGHSGRSRHDFFTALGVEWSWVEILHRRHVPLRSKWRQTFVRTRWNFG